MTSLPHVPCPVVLAAPSGTGKTSIARALVSGWDHYVFSVSATTRPPRRGERDGEHYHFVSGAEFQDLIDRSELVEWAEVHGHLYGTPKTAIEGPIGRGRHVVLDIDVQGARQVRERVPGAVLIFVFPPTARDLVARLTGRGTEHADDVRRRLTNARAELSAAEDFDYVVVNDDLSEAVAAVRAIVSAEVHRPGRAADLTFTVERLKAEIDEELAARTA
jgi:guanylate kinase